MFLRREKSFVPYQDLNPGPSSLTVKKKVKINFILQQAFKACRGDMGIALYFL